MRRFFAFHIQLIVVLTGASLFGMGHINAFAAEITDAKAQLSASVSEMEALSRDIQDGKALCDAWQAEVDELVEQALSVQDDMRTVSEKAGRTASVIYKQGGDIGLMEVLLSSQSISDLTSGISYLESIYSREAKLVQEKKALSDELEGRISQIEAKKDEQQELIELLEGEKTELAQKVSDMEARVDELEVEQQLSFAQANELAASQLFDTGDTTGWRTGIASAYGGHSDASVADNARTATGDPVTESTMGVAIPMAWDDFRSYFGRKVEISYGGKSVIATVNDCGGMGGGSRSLDLQPGVFRAFGCETCDAWGLRTVSFRFL